MGSRAVPGGGRGEGTAVRKEALSRPSPIHDVTSYISRLETCFPYWDGILSFCFPCGDGILSFARISFIFFILPGTV